MGFLEQSASLFHKGGPVMYLLVACSLIVVAVATERFLYYRNVSVEFKTFRIKLQPLLEQRNVTDAIQLCEQSPAIAAQVAMEGLCAYQRGSSMETALDGAAMLASAQLREYLNYLSAIVTLAPLLGLLGTVVGMISSFSVFNVQNGQPAAITGGVGEALVATATGLTVAILAFVVHTYFSQRLDKFVSDIEQTTVMVLNHLATPKTMKRDAHEIA
ncbi:biopolymer transport protein ExbB [Sporomusaceae bacterium FL31]|nr:Biopolymer transport protein ExbB [Sporomusaceae bacterium FL31]GCE35172.1 biopolymer transport protein ExbB [Sporomusaceae bacterium]